MTSHFKAQRLNFKKSYCREKLGNVVILQCVYIIKFIYIKIAIYSVLIMQI